MEPDQPMDPAKDKRLGAGYYGVMPNPADGSVWGTGLGFPGKLIRLEAGVQSSLDRPGGKSMSPPGITRRPPFKATPRAAWTSTARAWFGRSWPADTLPASIETSAPDR